jgi:cell division protein FtsB
VVELKRQLAIKEQDLTYAKQRNEKMYQEVESLKKELSLRTSAEPGIQITDQSNT